MVGEHCLLHPEGGGGIGWWEIVTFVVLFLLDLIWETMSFLCPFLALESPCGCQRISICVHKFLLVELSIVPMSKNSSLSSSISVGQESRSSIVQKLDDSSSTGALSSVQVVDTLVVCDISSDMLEATYFDQREMLDGQVEPSDKRCSAKIKFSKTFFPEL